VNEKRIREVIEVEKRALELVAQANREADQLPVQAEAEAAAIVEGAAGLLRKPPVA
jgi:vacuolar-type H+-ATPase subunit H